VLDPHLDHYRRAIEGKKREIERLSKSVLALLQGANDPNAKQHFQDACAQLRQAIADTQALFDSDHPIEILSTMSNAVLQLGRTPENFNYIIQLVDLMHRVPNIPYDEACLEDKLKKMVNEQQLQDKIDQLRDELKRLLNDYNNALDHKFMEEIQRLGEALQQARKKSLLEVFVTSGGIATVIGAAITAFTNTPVAPILAGIMQTAFEIHSWARDKQDDCMMSFLDDLNVRMPMGKSLLDDSLTFNAAGCLARLAVWAP
jgi:predicted NBD/HSP70 family sugar kinase